MEQKWEVLVPVGLKNFALDLVQLLRLDATRDEREETEQTEYQFEGSFLLQERHDGGLLDREVDAGHEVCRERRFSNQLESERGGRALCWISSALLNSSP